MDSIYAKRTTWVDFPPILVLYALNTLKNLDEDLYIQAKSGNELSAIKLLTQLMTQKDIASIKHCLQGKSPIIAPVLAQWWQNEFHFPLEYLTSGELGHFKKPKSLDEIRNRLIEAGLQKSLY